MFVIINQLTIYDLTNKRIIRIMKKFSNITRASLVLFGLTLSFTNIYAQGEEGLYLNGYALYAFDDSFDSYFTGGRYFEGKIKGGLQWGGGIEYRVYPETGIELLYLRHDTNAPTSYYIQGPEFADFDLGLNYIMVGGNRYMPIGTGNVDGSFGLMAGMVIADLTNPESGYSDSATKFAWGLKGGITIWATETVGIKLQAQVLSAVQSMGGGFYFGTGGGGAGISTYSTLYQFGLGGGLAFKLN